MKCFILVLFLCSLTACVNIPTSTSVPDSLGYEDMIVLAQREVDANNYRGAKVYYEIMIDRFGTDANVLNIGEFEIAHILIKQKKYEQAAVLLRQVLSRFEGSGSALLKPEYRKLAENDLKKIASKLSTPKSAD